MLQISTGIEPNFAFSYTRKTESLHGEDVFYKVFIPIAKKYMDEHNIENEDNLPEYFVTAQNLNPYDRIKMQGVWQRRIDASISSTINLINETTEEEVEQLYLYAWEKGLKGMTVYRAGCKREGILTIGNSKKEEKTKGMERGIMDKVPEDTIYIPKDMINGCGKAKVMIGFSPSENRVTDVYYIAKGQGGCSKNIQGEAILISQILRCGGNLEDIKKSFNGIDACSSCTISRMKGNEISGKNCPNILLNLVLETQKTLQHNPVKSIEHHKKNECTSSDKSLSNSKVTCPMCGEPLTPEGGCYTCHNCGYSKCD